MLRDMACSKFIPPLTLWATGEAVDNPGAADVLAVAYLTPVDRASSG